MCKSVCLLLLVLCAPPIAAQHFVGLGDDCPEICFTPSTLTIRVGESVTFYVYCTNFFHGPHNVVADDGSFRCARGCDGEGGDGTPVGCTIDASFTRTFSSPGVVKFHDEMSSATGTIVVSPGPAGSVVEFFNPELGHYFVTADPIEQAYVDTGALGHWERTGETFKSGGSTAVCRFGGNAAWNSATGRPWGPNSHFYTADTVECAGLKSLFDPGKPSWNFESYDFTTTPAGDDGCAQNLSPVYRAYNDGFAHGRDSNHRITANATAYQAMLAAGWIGEGIAMCAPR
jgi:plastocyanin